MKHLANPREELIWLKWIAYKLDARLQHTMLHGHVLKPSRSHRMIYRNRFGRFARLANGSTLRAKADAPVRMLQLPGIQQYRSPNHVRSALRDLEIAQLARFWQHLLEQPAQLWDVPLSIVDLVQQPAFYLVPGNGGTCCRTQRSQ